MAARTRPRRIPITCGGARSRLLRRAPPAGEYGGIPIAVRPHQKYLRYGLGSKILGGWELSGIVSAQTGFPFTINLRGDTAGVGAGTGGIFVRPNAVPGVSYQLPSSQMSTSALLQHGGLYGAGRGRVRQCRTQHADRTGIRQCGRRFVPSFPYQGKNGPAVPGGILQRAQSPEFHAGWTHPERSDVRPGTQPGRSS